MGVKGAKASPFQGGEEVSIKLYKLYGLSETFGNDFTVEKSRTDIKLNILFYYILDWYLC